VRWALTCLLAACAGHGTTSFSATPLVANDGDTVHFTFTLGGGIADINGQGVSGTSFDVKVAADVSAGAIARPFVLTINQGGQVTQQTVIITVLRLPATPVIVAPPSLIAPQTVTAIVAAEDGMRYGWRVSGTTAWVSGTESAALSFAVAVSGTLTLTCIAENALGRTAASAPVTIPVSGAAVIAGRPGVTGDADGPGATARFFSLTALQRVADGTLYGLDVHTHRIKRVSAVGSDWQVTTLAGALTAGACADGSGEAATFDSPTDLWLDTPNQRLLVSEAGTLGRVRAVSFAGAVTTLFASGDGSTDAACPAANHIATLGGVLALTTAPNNDIWGYDTQGQLFDLTTATLAATLLPGGSASLRFSDTTLLMLDGDAACVRRSSDFSTCWVGGAAGAIDGSGASAGFSQPQGMSASALGWLIGDIDTATGGLVRVLTDSGTVTTLAGVPSPLRTTTLALPFGALPTSITGLVDANGTVIVSGDDALLAVSLAPALAR
jgi:hypothetical protein